MGQNKTFFNGLKFIPLLIYGQAKLTGGYLKHPLLGRNLSRNRRSINCRNISITQNSLELKGEIKQISETEVSLFCLAVRKR
jgi:hypothetical protein